MDRRTVSLHIAGQSYKVVSTAPEGDLHRLAEVVGAKLAEVTPRGKAVTSQSMLLAAMALAHELEEERGRRAAVEQRAREIMRRTLDRIDTALETAEEGSRPAPGAGP